MKFEGEYCNNNIIEGNGYDIYNNKILFIQKDGKAEEYFNNRNFQFKGIYLNGKRWNGIIYDYNGKKAFIIKNGNGRQKEYNYYGALLFEGEYINGERNGKGKEYYLNGNLKFEGEYLNGKINGKGREYYKNNIIKFIGEYINGERNGKGKEFNDENNIIFKGEFLHGKKLNGKESFF